MDVKKKEGSGQYSKSQKKEDITPKKTQSAVEFKHGELREMVLSSIAVCLLVGGTLVFPNLPIAVGAIIKLVEEYKQSKIPHSKIKRVLKNLEKRKIISIEEKGDNAIVYLKDRNSTAMLKYSLKTLLNFKLKKKRWKKKWILVIFDVPEEERNKRDYLRKFLKDLGFYSYQKSVYIFPYECEEEVTLIKKIVEGGKYIKYIIAEKIEGESSARRHFNI